jgi:enamine deaminase RidA (YjgF/YER057c/UK114 family)
MARPQIIEPLGWGRPRGYSNGVAAEGRWLFIAGQIGWDPRASKPKLERTFTAQFDRALANVVAVVREAGGVPGDVARVTLYVTDKREYLSGLAAVGKSWKRHLGRHFPAMTLVVVKALLEPQAKVEIEATAVL